MDPDKVSVIIPSWNRKDDLLRALKSIYRQDYKNFEIIVADNGSTDGTIEILKEFPKVKLIQNKTNLGTSIAKNQGIATATGNLILFLDSDIEMSHEKCISNMVGIMQSHPEIGALGGEAYKTAGGTITKRKEITPNCETATYIMDSDDYKLHECGYIATCNCMMRKSELIKCKGFDNHIIYAGEDKEIGYKLKKLNLKSVIDSRCLVYHYVSQTNRSSNFYAFHKNRIRIFIKNYPAYKIPLLPFMDIWQSISPKKIEELKQNNRDITKWVHDKETNVKKSSMAKKLIMVGGNYAWSLMKAYAWNLAYLPDTLLTRIKNPDYIEETRRKWL